MNKSVWILPSVVCILAFLAGVLTGALLVGRKPSVADRSYEECVLREMRGQPKDLIRIAKNLCRTRFPVAEGS
jgi:hypothetical protein